MGRKRRATKRGNHRRPVLPDAGLASLLAPMTTDDFFDRFWPHEAVVAHGEPARLAGLVDAAELRDLAKLVALPARQLLAQSQSFENRFGNVPVPSEAALPLLAAGMTLYVVEPRFESPSLHEWFDALSSDLALDPGVLRPSVFLSRRGAGARLHFDNTESFVVQVSGRKVWTLAPNQHVPNPPANHIAGNDVSEELAPLVPAVGLPTELPPSARRVELVPGSVLYLPRGWWHTTQTLEDSVHLDLLMALPTWADVLLAPIAEALSLLPHWRAPATTTTLAAEMARRLAEDVAELVARPSGHD